MIYYEVMPNGDITEHKGDRFFYYAEQALEKAIEIKEKQISDLMENVGYLNHEIAEMKMKKRSLKG